MTHHIAMLIGMTLSGVASAATASPQSPSRWTVEHVLTDPAIDNAAQRYFSEDPRLLGRMITLGRALASLDDGGGACMALRRRIVMQTPTAAIATKLSHRGEGRAVHPTPADLGLTAGSKPVRVTYYTCAGPGDVPPGRAWTGAVSFALPGNRMALIWADEVVLVLTPGVAPARASFDCARAAVASEKAICADPGLASWDRSVARSLTVARQGSTELGPVADLQALVLQQRAWLTQRNACGNNRTCLRSRMAERTEILSKR